MEYFIPAFHGGREEGGGRGHSRGFFDRSIDREKRDIITRIKDRWRQKKSYISNIEEFTLFSLGDSDIMGSLIASITPGCATSSLIRPRFLSRRIHFVFRSEHELSREEPMYRGKFVSFLSGFFWKEGRKRISSLSLSFFFFSSFAPANFAPFRSDIRCFG